MENITSFMPPQVLLIGNGLNIAHQGSKWECLIKSIWANEKVQFESVGEAPFPLQAVIATQDSIDTTLKKKPDLFFGLESVDEIRETIECLLDVGFDHILTTNYSYEIERVACPSVARDGEHCAALVKHTDGCKRAEPKYMLHTYNQVIHNDRINKVWHIHGEIRKPQSVVLGHYLYGNLLNRYIKELENRGNVQAIRQEKGEPPIIESWLDAFIMGDVYILGFGYDFSELDMWWLLNRKKREKAKHGKVVFYEPSFKNEIKRSLLDTYGVHVENLGRCTETPDYAAFYEDAIADIQKRVNEVREKENYHV